MSIDQLTVTRSETRPVEWYSHLNMGDWFYFGWDEHDGAAAFIKCPMGHTNLSTGLHSSEADGKECVTKFIGVRVDLLLPRATPDDD